MSTPTKTFRQRDRVIDAFGRPGTVRQGTDTLGPEAHAIGVQVDGSYGLTWYTPDELEPAERIERGVMAA